jgi:predicted RNA binding protein YcfA (HicA-like mRNA interferase family)
MSNDLLPLHEGASAHIFAHEVPMPSLETNTRQVVRRLEREGWVNVGGGKHDKFEHADKPRVMIMVPRHRELSPPWRGASPKPSVGCEENRRALLCGNSRWVQGRLGCDHS